MLGKRERLSQYPGVARILCKCYQENCLAARSPDCAANCGRPVLLALIQPRNPRPAPSNRLSSELSAFFLGCDDTAKCNAVGMQAVAFRRLEPWTKLWRCAGDQSFQRKRLMVLEPFSMPFNIFLNEGAFL